MSANTPAAPYPASDLVAFETLGGWKMSVQRGRILAVVQRPVEWQVYVDLPSSATPVGAYYLVTPEEAARLSALLSLEGIMDQTMTTSMAFLKKHGLA